MPRIKIEDLPQDMKISKEEMKKVMGGIGFQSGGFGDSFRDSEETIPDQAEDFARKWNVIGDDILESM